MFMNREDGMPYDRMLSRRALLRSAATTAAGLCAAALPVRAAGPTVVGFIYVGPRDDFGYNQAHAQGAAAVAKMAGVKVVEEEKVPETADVQKTMGSMITLDGATLLFPTSFGYFDPHILKVAPQYPKVTFLHAGVCGALRRSRCVAPWQCGRVTVTRDCYPDQGWAHHARISSASLATPDPDASGCDAHRLFDDALHPG